jgi:hypothetical protein
MGDANVLIAAFHLADEASRAMHALCEAGVDRSNLSIVGRDLSAEKRASAYCLIDGRLTIRSESGSFWEEIALFLTGWGVFTMPRIGVLLAAGSVATWIAESHRNPGLFPGLTPLGAGLCSFGVSRGLIPFYEAEVRAGVLLLIVHGSAKDIRQARGSLSHWIHSPASLDGVSDSQG